MATKPDRSLVIIQCIDYGPRLGPEVHLSRQFVRRFVKWSGTAVPGSSFTASLGNARSIWLNPILLAGASLATFSLLPPGECVIATLVGIIVLGVPHGALDGELARTALRPRFGLAWFGVFALPYLTLSALVLLSWRLAPIPTLAIFLAASVWHFGSEEIRSADPVAVIAAGGAPIALAVLAHPIATTGIFAIVAQAQMTEPPTWLWVACLLWLVPAVSWVVRLIRLDRRYLLAFGLTAASAITLPPLTSFSIYFVCVHSPAHVRSLIQERRHAPRIVDAAAAVRLALPVTLLTLLLGASLWVFYSGATDRRLLCLTIQGLAALTLPHLLLEMWLCRRVQSSEG